ncbi:retron Ec67 family RNA-directed DNA polymerase/endonuclease [Tahibacter sp. UC22_41]|uniref:retron Ec67 family RNA-directed DNA polymerase/endonuclease n=1 Tax=Tahibacter sp. UC22_41 TaxID=3350178 RepID=UPI0036DC69D6
MSALDLIKSAKSLADLAHLMGFKASAITYLIRKLPPAARYTQFDIPKRSGGTRTISAPIPSLKLLQKHLAEHLAKCEQEIEEKRKVSKSLSHGFKIGHSILTNAQTHRKKRFVFNIDLKDFFDTINFGRVRGFFIKNNDFQLHPDVATTIAQIACHNNSLPQGAPTSPVISNLITNVLDIRLAKLAKRLSCSYTRYADDITFSTSRSEFPKDLVATSGSLTGSLAIGKKLRKEIQSCGFSINEQKTRLQFFRSRQDVTGLVVNRQISAPIEYRRMLRAMVNRYCKTGTYERHSISIVGEDSVVVKQEGSPASLHGMLNYILQIERWRIKDLVSDPIPPEKENGLTSTKKLLRRFLFTRNLRTRPNQL